MLKEQNDAIRQAAELRERVVAAERKVELQPVARDGEILEAAE